MKKLAILVLAVILVSGCFPNIGPEGRKGFTDLMQEIGDSIQKAEERRLAWDYEILEDEMTSEKIYTAEITSPDDVSLDEPYYGSAKLTLYLRKEGDVTEVYIGTSNGELIHEEGDPTILVRFDSDPAEKYEINEPVDMDESYRYIADPEVFLAKLKKAKTVKMEIMFSENGAHIYRFNTEGLKWDM